MCDQPCQECHQCDQIVICSHCLDKTDSPIQTVCNHTICPSCTILCEACDEAVCPACVVKTENGKYCNVECVPEGETIL